MGWGEDEEDEEDCSPIGATVTVAAVVAAASIGLVISDTSLPRCKGMVLKYSIANTSNDKITINRFQNCLVSQKARGSLFPVIVYRGYSVGDTGDDAHRLEGR